MNTREIHSDHPFLGDAPLVRLGTTAGPVGLVFVRACEGAERGPVAHFSPNKARELAFSLLDLADIADIEAGSYSPDLDPFETAHLKETVSAH